MAATVCNMKNYDEEYRQFRWEVPEKFNFAVDVIDRWAADRTKLAIILVDDEGNEENYTFWDMKMRSNKFANILKNAGLKKGDVVMVFLPRVIEWWESLLGIMKIGAISAPGTTQQTSRDIKYRIVSARAKAIITDAANADKVDAIAAECPDLQIKIVTGGQNRPGWINYQAEMKTADRYFEAVETRSEEGTMIYFTSGTTGYPKMVLHSHASYPYAHKVTGKYWLDLTPQDLHCNLTDTGWGKAAWSSLFGPWHMGAALLIHKAVGKFNPERTLQILADYGATTLCAAPTAYRLFVQQDLQKYDLSNLRHCVAAGEPLNPEVIAIWERYTGLKIHDGYGQTETVLTIATFPGLPVKPGSMGRPTPGFRVEVIDEAGKILPANKEGDIAIWVKDQRPAGLFKEYLGDPEGTKARFRHGWYLTGDRAYRDEDGYFWFVGRADDVILSSGYRIGPFEVESALVEHPAVIEAAVVASPDKVRGEIVKAFVILSPKYTPSAELIKELQDYVKTVTAPYKYPREIEFVKELPKTISGKIRRVELRELERKRKLGNKANSEVS
ncbi:MAG TPA: AMP-binding protein [Bacillota bacterium]